MHNERKIAVIMPVYLGDYQGASSNRQLKYIRAINSFNVQQYKNKHLIIVVDGCEITKRLNEENNLHKYDNIHIINAKKHDLFSGQVRQLGLDYAYKSLNPKIITYLDCDDVIAPGHLKLINKQMNNYDWIYYADYLAINPDENVIGLRTPEMQFGKIGTSNISHRSMLGADWNGCDGWGHDWTFIQKLNALSSSSALVDPCQYFVHHIKGWFDT